MFTSLRTRPGAPRILLVLSVPLWNVAEHSHNFYVPQNCHSLTTAVGSGAPWRASYCRNRTTAIHYGNRLKLLVGRKQGFGDILAAGELLECGTRSAGTQPFTILGVPVDQPAGDQIGAPE